MLSVKNTVNTIFSDINENYYRTDMNYFDYVLFLNKNSGLSFSKGFQNLETAIEYYSALPVFFTKNIMGVVYGELPEFGLFSDIVLYMDTMSLLFYSHFIFPIHYYQWFREDYFFDISNWIMIIAIEPLVKYAYSDIFDYFDKIKNIFFDNSNIFDWLDYKGKVDFFFNSRLLSLPFWIFTTMFDQFWCFLVYIFS